MPYCNNPPSYDINLCAPPRRRWAEVVEKEKKVMVALGKEAREDIREVSHLLLSPTLHKVFDLAYRCFGGCYQQEMRYIARGMGVPASLGVVLNCTYELSHMLDGPTPFGCTAGVKWVPGVGMVHVRNMDWPLAMIGPATCLFNYTDGDRSFVSVGITGLVGVLSGMLPGGYSVTINWAPSLSRPTWDWGPLFLLRHVLETCDTYDEAVMELADTPISTSVFYVVCGTKKGQACVLERTSDDCEIREMGRSDVLVQSNHFQSERMRRFNKPLYQEEEGYELVITDSRERAYNLEHKLLSCSKYDTVVRCLDHAPQHNEFSYQQMAFVPKSGKVDVWRYV